MFKTVVYITAGNTIVQPSHNNCVLGKEDLYLSHSGEIYYMHSMHTVVD